MLGERPLSNLARELLARERGQVEDEALKNRALERARAALPGERASSVGFRSARPLAASSQSRRLLRTLPLIAASLAAVGLAIAGVGAYLDKSTPPERAPGTQVSPPALQNRPLSIGGALPNAAPVPQPAAEPAPQSRAETATPPPTGDGTRPLNIKQFAAELALLEPARSSISRGDYAGALTAINQHRREFPASQLSEEREALRIRALWGLGQRPAALNAAKSFRKRYPRSSLLGWLKDQGDTQP